MPAELTRRVKILSTAGVMLALLLAALDQTIVGTALPRIVSELNGLDRYSWLITGYLVSSTVMVPIAGKLGDLAEMLEVAPRTITGLIDNLERDGWVQRLPDPTDRRSIQAQLTKKGLDQVQAMLRDVRHRQASTTTGLSPDELVQLRHLCLRLVQNIDRTEGVEHAR